MALEVLSGAGYNDSAKQYQKGTIDTGLSRQGTVNLNITEAPANITTSGSKQTEQDKGQQKPASEKQIRDAITKANNTMKGHLTRCEFSYHEETKRVSIKVIDRETDKIIREIPPEETLEMVEKMWDLAGLLVDERR